MLVLTATPIPRTLVLTYFGDMDISRAAREAGRPPADRHPHHRRSTGSTRWSTAVGRALDDGQRVYWVCPLVEESETSDLAAAEERFAELQAAIRRRASISSTAR